MSTTQETPAAAASTTVRSPDAAPAVAAVAAGPRSPRVAIQFCTQCKWMLRAAYFAQELLSTFGPALGEVALQPATGGVFTVTIETAAMTAPRLLWDRKTEGGFPETKELKRRVRDVIEPGRDLGHVDRHNGPVKAEAAPETTTAPAAPTAPTPALTSETKATGPACEDCQ